ncbi:hypothetical protein A0256_23775 [Mucilaginibacter sp. PAMC 26640]|nr:hypothetical protein A0256_23775 [Mucilaginibacter sp. PAMC 26640]
MSTLENNPTELPLYFDGRGEVKGFVFKQVKRSNTAYLYEVSDTFGNKWYEVFKRKINARFGNIVYPKQDAFGVSAWSARTFELANQRFELITERSVQK